MSNYVFPSVGDGLIDMVVDHCSKVKMSKSIARNNARTRQNTFFSTMKNSFDTAFVKFLVILLMLCYTVLQLDI